MSEIETTVIYHKETKEILVISFNDTWVLPAEYDIATFKGGVEPMLINTPDGNVLLKENSIYIPGGVK